MQFILGATPLLVALIGLYLTSLYGYLLFHGLAETFSIVIAGGIFMVAWNARRYLQNHYLLFIGIAYLFVGGIDLLHTLAFKGMGVFEGYGANLPTQLWIAARYMEALSILLATFFLHRRLNRHWTLLGYGLTTALLLLSIFRWKVFPDCFIEGVGLTPFKIYSEYVICLILLASIGFLLKNSSKFDKGVLVLVVVSISTAIVSELAFTTYLSVYGFSNLLGHLLKIISFYLVYKAIIVTGIVAPCNLLFRDLKQSEAKFRSIFETNVVPIVYSRTDGRIIDANEDYLKLVGFTKEELKAGKAHWDVATPPEWKHMDDLALEYLKRDGICPPLEKEYQRRDGTRVPVLIGACLIPENPEQVVAFAVDLTERKRMEEELRAARDELELRVAERTRELLAANEALHSAQELLTNILENTPTPVHVTSTTGRIRMVNGAWEEFASRKREDVIGLPAESVFAVDNINRFRETDMKVVEACTPLAMIEAVKTKKGTRYFHTVKFPLRDSSGQVDSIGVISMDVTEETRAQEELKAYTARLELVNAELQEFAFVASHDLQEPLRKIQTFASRLKSRCWDSLGEEGCDYLTRMEKSANRMSALLSALLDYSRVATKSKPFAPIALSNIAEEVLQNLEVLIKDAGARIEVANLPTVEADPAQMRQLLHNLISNALKYRRNGDPPVIRVRGDIDGKELRITVEDNGIGFDEKYLDKIFKPFQRLHGRTSGYDGIGMGLAISRKIAERHGGTITARSKVGEGSTFVVTLPASQPAPSARESILMGTAQSPRD